MKNLKLLILFCSFLFSLNSIAQNPTGEESEFDKGIRNNLSPLVLVPNYLVTQGATGVYGKIEPINLGISTSTQTALDSKVDKNTTITGATNTKITYDSKGLVTSGTGLSAGDIPTLNQNTTGTASTITGNITQGQVTNLTTDLSNKVDKVSGKSLLSDAEITRITTLTNYTHPVNHPPSIIEQNASNRFVTDAEKSTWNGKQSSLGYTPENVANKSDSFTVSSSTTYSSTKALVDGLGVVQKDVAYVDANGNNATAVLGNIRKPYSTIDSALDALPNTGGTVKIGSGTFNAPTLSKIKDNVKFIGSGKPYPNMVTTYIDEFTKPTITSPTKLVGGTILNGKFDLNNKNNIEVSNLGVDAGKLWIDANNGGVALDAFRTSTQNALVPNSSVPPAYGIVVDNVSALCYSSGALIHSILIENTIDAKISNISTYFGYHGLVIKSKGTNVDNVESYGHSGEGVIIKADTYSYSSDININNVFISSIGDFDGGGLMVDGGSGKLQRVNISNLTVAYTTFGVTDTFNSNIDGVNLNNISVYKTQGSGVYFGATSKNITLNNIQQDGTIAGSGIELHSSLGFNKTISNSSTKNSAYYGFYLVGGTGNIQVNNLSSISDVSGIALSGNVYGANVNSTSTLTGTLTLNTGNINAKNIASVIGASDTIGLGSAIYFDNNLSNSSKRFFVPQMNASNGLDFWQFNGTDWVNTGTKINVNGSINVGNLTGTGTRTVVADASGNLSATGVGYRVYTALLTQTGTSAPVATVLENTLGINITFTRSSTGFYLTNTDNLFNEQSKMVFFATPSTSNSGVGIGISKAVGVARIEMKTTDSVGSISDGAMSSPASIEIRVYNFMLLFFPYSMLKRRKRKIKQLN